MDGIVLCVDKKHKRVVGSALHLDEQLQHFVELRPHFAPNHIKSLPPHKYENRVILCHYSLAKKLWSLTIFVDSASAHRR